MRDLLELLEQRSHRVGCFPHVVDADALRRLDEIAGLAGAELAVVRLRDEALGDRIALVEAGDKAGGNVVGRKEVHFRQA